MTRISYPGHPIWSESKISVQPLPKVILDICQNLGIEADFSPLENLTSIEQLISKGKEQHEASPVVQKRKKSELLHQQNEEIITELTRKQSELEQQRLDDVEAGEQNLETLEELASIKNKLGILTAENLKLNNKVFDNLRDESHAYATLLKDNLRDTIYSERCKVRGELRSKIEKLITDNSDIFAQFVAMDTHTDFTRIDNEVKKALNI